MVKVLRQIQGNGKMEIFVWCGVETVAMVVDNIISILKQQRRKGVCVYRNGGTWIETATYSRDDGCVGGVIGLCRVCQC